jgi:hypothetical protein
MIKVYTPPHAENAIANVIPLSSEFPKIIQSKYS